MLDKQPLSSSPVIVSQLHSLHYSIWCQSGMSDTAEAPARFATCLVAVDIDLAEKSTIFWSPGRKTMRDNEESTHVENVVTGRASR